MTKKKTTEKPDGSRFIYQKGDEKGLIIQLPKKKKPAGSDKKTTNNK